MESNLFQAVRTISDRTLCIQALDLVKASTFSTKKVTSDANPFLPLVQELCAKAGDPKKEVETLRNLLLKAPVVRVSLAISPSSSLVDQIVARIRQTKGKEHVLVECTVDPTIIAGIVITAEGKLADHSLARRLQEIDLSSILSTHLSL